MILRALILLSAFVAILWLPWSVTLVFIFAAAIVTPPAALALGLFADALYMSHAWVPLGSAWGLLLMLLAILVRHFARSRIMGA